MAEPVTPPSPPAAPREFDALPAAEQRAWDRAAGVRVAGTLPFWLIVGSLFLLIPAAEDVFGRAGAPPWFGSLVAAACAGAMVWLWVRVLARRAYRRGPGAAGAAPGSADRAR